MDKITRSSIQRATQVGRVLLEKAFSEQLEGAYDILLDGTISEQEGSHLNDRQIVIREKLVAAIEYKRSTGLNRREAVDAYLREAAFTTLNRFVALKMLEARELVQECVSKSDNSRGFKEFTALAPSLVESPDKGYRLYIETLFDEIGREVKFLFDRRDVVSLLWPARQTLLDLLNILNASELASVWGEDETIGWMYQYFNSDEDIRSARYDEHGRPKAPLTSRELAVRNQYFTPRYVVQFLTDNTLGRIWYEMMHGKTDLVQLEYLVHRTNEVFLAEGVSVPEMGLGINELGQEELLQQTVYVPFRTKKDPRDLLILDPACGSGHFLLYAFKLLVSIYEEAWFDADAAAFTKSGTQLRNDFSSREELQRAIPELILRHNLYGVEIDPRAAQIASLALWLRAQRAYNEIGVSRAERAQITKTNIVVAEPMPGDSSLVEEFAASLEPPVLGDLFKKMVEDMKLAGELGSLLRIEESTARAVSGAAETHRQGSLFAEKLESQEFWDTADEKIIAALASFAESTAGNVGVRRQLFAGDAAHGVAFIELMRKRFDVVLTNPPFGDAIATTTEMLIAQQPASKGNLYAAFLLEAPTRLAVGGLLGAIVDATFVFQTLYRDFRGLLLDETKPPHIRFLVSNGWGVLDAYVETACLISSNTPVTSSATFFDYRDSEAAELLLPDLRSIRENRSSPRIKNLHPSVFRSMPNSLIGHWLPESLINIFHHGSTAAPQLYRARCGMNSSDNFRFYRLWWEVSSSEIGKDRSWAPLSNGGAPSPFLRLQRFLVRWANSGHEVKAYLETKYGGSYTRNIRNEKWYFKPGFTYGKRTGSYTLQYLPEGSVFTNEGQAVFPAHDQQAEPLIAYLNSSMVAWLLESSAGQHKEAGYIDRLPAPPAEFSSSPEVSQAVESAFALLAQCSTIATESQHFVSPVAVAGHETTCPGLAGVAEYIGGLSQQFNACLNSVDNLLEASFGYQAGGEVPWSRRSWEIESILFGSDAAHLTLTLAQNLVDYLIGCVLGRWDVSVAWLRPTAAELWESRYAPFNGVSPGLLLTSLDEVIREKEGNWNGLAVEDVGHSSDLATAVQSALALVWPNAKDEVLEEVVGILSKDLNSYISSEAFTNHLSRYRTSRRQAPVYWQLATPSASYSVWCYYHRLSGDTFFRVANDYITPKIDHEEFKLNMLRQEAGTDASSKQRSAINAQETFVGELRAFRSEVNRIAPMWNPNFNDGVIINFAPLWRLVPQQKRWQKECKKAWDTLVSGDYDWAHLAMHLWPERVVPKCQDDRSLAIAHGIEDDFWSEDSDGKWHKTQVCSDRIQELVAERASTAVKAALNELLEAPHSIGKPRRKLKVKA